MCRSDNNMPLISPTRFSSRAGLSSTVRRAKGTARTAAWPTCPRGATEEYRRGGGGGGASLFFYSPSSKRIHPSPANRFASAAVTLLRRVR